MQPDKNITYMSKDFLFGIRAVIEAIRSDKEIDKILIKKGLQGELIAELLEEVKALQIPVQYVPIERINRVTRKNHQGVVAFISPVSFHNPEDVIPILYEDGKTPLIMVLDRVSDVRNFGAITRSAECAGVDAIIIPEKGAAQINADAVKTSAGALHHIKVCRTKNLNKTLHFLKDSGIQLVAATEKATDNYYTTDMVVPTAIIMGSEESGISSDILRITDKMVKIPIYGNIESLNVSAAASVLIYEAIRQRNI